LQKGQRFRPFLNKAKGLEKRFDWLGAVGFYEEAFGLALRLEDFLKAAEVRERMGFCFFRAALQAETHRDFRSRMKLAVGAYERAAELFGKVKEGGKRARINHCKAMAAYVSSWLAADPSKKRELLDECRRLGKEALKDYEEAGDGLGYGRVCNDLLHACTHRLLLVLDWPELEGIVEEALNLGEKAIVALSEAGDDYELARAYCWTSFHYTYAVWYRAHEEKKEEFGQKCLSYSKNALKLSEKIGDPYLIGIANLSAGLSAFLYAGKLHSARKFFENQQKQGAIAKDNYLTGTAATWLAFTIWLTMLQLEEDQNRQREGFKKATEYAEDALRHLRVIAHRPQIVFTY
jgi:hypothetical protein